MDPTMKYYHLANTTTNELIFAKWRRCPCREQIQSIRDYFGWDSKDDLELRGRHRSFKLIGDQTLIFDSNVAYSRIIPDRTYLVTFNPDNDIDTTLVADTYVLIEDMLQ